MPSSNPAAIDMIRRLVAFDTTSRDSNLALIDYVSDYLKKLGIGSQLVFDETRQEGESVRDVRPATTGPA